MEKPYSMSNTPFKTDIEINIEYVEAIDLKRCFIELEDKIKKEIGSTHPHFTEKNIYKVEFDVGYTTELYSDDDSEHPALYVYLEENEEQFQERLKQIESYNDWEQKEKARKKEEAQKELEKFRKEKKEQERLQKEQDERRKRKDEFINAEFERIYGFPVEDFVKIKREIGSSFDKNEEK